MDVFNIKGISNGTDKILSEVIIISTYYQGKGNSKGRYKILAKINIKMDIFNIISGKK